MSAVELPPPEQLNRFQRWYFAWAQPYYERMDPALRADVVRIDRYLYSRRGAWVWITLVAVTGGSVAALVAGGFPIALALVCSLLVCISLPLAVLGAWLKPDRFSTRRLLRHVAMIFAGAYLGALSGFLVGRFERHGGLALDTLGPALWDAAIRATPLLLLAVVVATAMSWGVAQLRRSRLQSALQRARLEQERDAAARDAAEARLRLLQLQIQPHFLFNTLAALQHWVDTGDERAGPLLRSLTAFLRGSVTMLDRGRVTIELEAAQVRSYLDIMCTRLTPRLSASVLVEPAAGAVALPAGVLLTLVENAVEHGITPALQGGRIEVVARVEGRSVELRVEDSGCGLAPGWSDGVGLRNTRERLAGVYGDRARLTLEPRPGVPGCIARLWLHEVLDAAEAPDAGPVHRETSTA